MRELVAQMAVLGSAGEPYLADPSKSALGLDHAITTTLRSNALPTAEFGAPLAASVIPWIDRAVDDGQTREEWKGMAETNKILGQNPPIAVDGICVRIG